MAATNNPQRVDTPPLVAPRVSFLRTVPKVDGERFDWPGGIVFKPQSYVSGGREKLTGCGDVDGFTFADICDGTPVDAGAFVVYAAEYMSSFGLNVDERRTRVLDQLAAVESFQIAEEFWSGGLIDTGDPDQRILRSVASDTLTTAAVAPEVALAIVEAGLAVKGKGQRGMVHVTPQTLTALHAATAIRREGDVYLTPNDHFVVADAGYPGTGPTGHARTSTSVWMYGTSMVRLWVGGQFFLGAGAEVDPTFFDPSVNTLKVVAARPVLIQWDEQVHVAAETNLTLPLVAGAS